MKHQILLLGKIKDSYIEEGVLEFSKRLKHYANFELKYLKTKGRKGSQLSTEAEGKILLENVPQGALIVALDIKGKMLSSEQLAQQIMNWENTNTKNICYLIGGPLGLSSEVLDKAHLKLSFSKMTFTHDMVRLLLIEQLYRAYTIKAGEKYHK